MLCGSFFNNDGLVTEKRWNPARLMKEDHRKVFLLEKTFCNIKTKAENNFDSIF